MKKLTYRYIVDIQNYYIDRIAALLRISIPKIIFIKNTNEIKYVYDKYVEDLINKLLNECNKKINEIINEPTFNRRITNSRRIVSNEF